ncbi:MAG: hypothetical protein EHM57_08090 [Actinobacteria bacterium]|nr:MAG: hypothetical protein EHM57_08090 [Actinomycetota bacterium]
MTSLTSSGISVDLPQGWEAEIYRRPEDALTFSAGRGEACHAVFHAANFPLPPERGDFGSGAVEIMRSHEVLVILFEHGPESVGTTLFSYEGIPIPLDAADFSPDMMQRALVGQAGAQKFFTVNGRAFCLYVVLGSYANRQALVATANALLATLDISSL